jgi:hypothetical protein
MFSKVFKLEEGVSIKFSDLNQHSWFAKYTKNVEKFNLFPDRKNYLQA